MISDSFVWYLLLPVRQFGNSLSVLFSCYFSVQSFTGRHGRAYLFSSVYVCVLCFVSLSKLASCCVLVKRL